MTFFVVDVEADGPAAGLFSMVSFGIVRVDDTLATHFFGQTRPISERWSPEALAVSGVTREEHLQYEAPATVMHRCAEWIHQNTEGKPVLVSDNPAFDWSWMNYYFHVFTEGNPFGHSARRIGDLYSGLMQNLHAPGSEWRKLSITKPTHHPVIDAIGNAEAFKTIISNLETKHPGSNAKHSQDECIRKLTALARNAAILECAQLSEELGVPKATLEKILALSS